MSDLQQTGGVNQGSKNTTDTGNPQNIGNPFVQPSSENPQLPGSNSSDIGVSIGLSQGSSGVLSVTTSSGSPTSSVKQQVTETKLTPDTQFAVPAWAMILAGCLVILAGISFIWGQRHDITRNT